MIAPSEAGLLASPAVTASPQADSSILSIADREPLDNQDALLNTDNTSLPPGNSTNRRTEEL